MICSWNVLSFCIMLHHLCLQMIYRRISLNLFVKKFQVWKNYVCEVSEWDICTTVGRVTPEIYSQLAAAANESYALEHYAPVLLSLQNCNFVRDAFTGITSSYCPPLIHYLEVINVGLGLISVGVLLCLVLWILYANRPQRGEVFATLSLAKIKNRFNKNHNSRVLALPNASRVV